MNHKGRTRLCALLALAAVVGWSTHAQDRDGDDSRRGARHDAGARARSGGDQRSRRGGRGGGPLMRLLDADRDGVLSSAEIDKVTETLKALEGFG